MARAGGAPRRHRVAWIGGRPAPIDGARELGVDVVLVHERGRYDPSVAAHTERIVHVCITDGPAIAAALGPLHAERPFDRILTTSEPAGTATGYVVDALGVPGVGESTQRTVKDKSLTRAALARSGASPVRYRVVDDADQAARFVRELGGPAVLKPVDGAASRHIHLVQDPGQAMRTFALMRDEGLPRALVEEYLPGPVVSVEAFSFDGRHLVVGFCQYRVSERYVEWEVRTPSVLARPWIPQLRELTCRLLDAVGLTEGPSHTEFVLTPDAPRVLESHARLGGHAIPELIRRAYGVDLARMMLTVPLGLEPLPQSAPDPIAGAAIRFFLPAPGRVAAVSVDPQVSEHVAQMAPGEAGDLYLPWLDRVRPLKVGAVLAAAVGDDVPPLRTLADCSAGYVLATGTDVDDASAACDRIEAGVRFELRRHVLVIHRWKDRYALYDDYLDHEELAVTYVTTALGRSSVPERAAGVVEVARTDDLEQVREAAARLAERFGRIERVVALNEGDLEAAARLRDELGTPGQGELDLLPFRDKLAMVELVAAAGLPTPAFADAPDPEAVLRFADQQGWPVVVKPRRGTASRGVVVLHGPQDLPQLDAGAGEGRIVETFVDDPVHHIDGWWDGARLGPWRASRYVNTCPGFAHGDVLGSFEVDDPAALAAIGAITERIAGAFGPRPWVFHLELFVGREADGRIRTTFLEAGCRVGGAEIPFVWREVHGVDLMRVAVDIQLGRSAGLPEPPATSSGAPTVVPGALAGWLLVPVPTPAPCRVRRAELEIDPSQAPYAQVLPSPGQVIPKVGGYEHVGGRFRFAGSTSAEVEKAITTTAAQVRLECEPAVTS